MYRNYLLPFQIKTSIEIGRRIGQFPSTTEQVHITATSLYSTQSTASFFECTSLLTFYLDYNVKDGKALVVSGKSMLIFIISIV